MGFLHRNLKSCPLHIKESCYKSLVISILEYACTIWDPYTQKDISTIEKIQGQASRFVSSNYLWSTSATNLINNLKWESLQSIEEKIWKLPWFIRNNLVNIPCNHCLIPSTSITRHHQYCYQLQTATYTFIFPSAIRLWNNLSQQQVDAHSLTTFKQTLWLYVHFMFMLLIFTHTHL